MTEKFVLFVTEAPCVVGETISTHVQGALIGLGVLLILVGGLAIRFLTRK